jgi:hypothetical protein
VPPPASASQSKRRKCPDCLASLCAKQLIAWRIQTNMTIEANRLWYVGSGMTDDVRESNSLQDEGWKP